MRGTEVRGALLVGLVSCLIPAPAASSESGSSNFRNTRSALSAGGMLMASAGFKGISTLGEVAATTRTSAGYLSRSGLMPIYSYPGRIMDFAANGCRSSELRLTWTAPGEDGYAAGTSARSYVLKVSSDPAFSPGNSLTLFLSAAALNPAPGSPRVRGSSETLDVTGLTDGVTYYFAIAAVGADRDLGVLSPGATNQLLGRGPALTGFTAVTGFRAANLAWNAASGVPGACTPVAYRVYRSTMQTTDFAVLADTDTITLPDPALSAGSTYFYRLVGLNSSNVEITTFTEAFVFVHSAPPTPPTRVALSVFSSSATLTWAPPVAFDIGVDFAQPSAAADDEINRFHLWRSTGLLYPTWSLIGSVSTTTVQFTDPASPAGAYYHISASNVSDHSRPSVIIDHDSQTGFVLAPDLRTHLYFSQGALAELSADPVTAYWVRASSSPIASDSNILENATFDLMTQHGVPAGLRHFENPIEVRMSYELGPGGGIQARAGGEVEPDQAALYWNNGAKYVKVYGRNDSIARFMVLPTQAPGSFQLRGVSRQSKVDFDVSGISNKFLTPNGDGRNDNVVIRFDNPRDSEITGRIYDLKGGLVTTLSRKTQFTMEWDGRANGQTVPGGVYIYQLEGDGKVYNGTLVVIK